jgi:hypothetical protein
MDQAGDVAAGAGGGVNGGSDVAAGASRGVAGGAAARNQSLVV